MHIGLIGGIGPAATLVYYNALVRAHADADRRLALTIVNADVREMTGNMAAGRVQEQAEIFAAYIDQLRAGGCEAAALTSMGGHFCIKALEPISSLPLISAVPAMDAYFAASGAKRIGVLGTRAVMDSKIYGLSSVEVVAPPSEEIPEVHAAYIAIATSGVATQQQRDFFHEAGRKLHEDHGAEIVVLGGTDLSVAFTGSDPGYPIADSALIHADAIARAAMAQ
jgi:aspartate racemase